MSCVQDSSVIQLTQDLAKSLGLKIRKAYVRTKVHTPSTVGVSLCPSLRCEGEVVTFLPQPALNVLQSSSCPDAACEKASSRCSVNHDPPPHPPRSSLTSPLSLQASYGSASVEEIEIGKLTRPPLMLREGGQETLTRVSRLFQMYLGRSGTGPTPPAQPRSSLLWPKPPRRNFLPPPLPPTTVYRRSRRVSSRCRGPCRCPPRSPSPRT